MTNVRMQGFSRPRWIIGTNMQPGTKQLKESSSGSRSFTQRPIGKICRMTLLMLMVATLVLSLSKSKGLTAAPDESPAVQASIQLSTPTFGVSAKSTKKTKADEFDESAPMVIQPRRINAAGAFEVGPAVNRPQLRNLNLRSYPASDPSGSPHTLASESQITSPATASTEPIDTPPLEVPSFQLPDFEIPAANGPDSGRLMDQVTAAEARLAAEPTQVAQAQPPTPPSASSESGATNGIGQPQATAKSESKLNSPAQSPMTVLTPTVNSAVDSQRDPLPITPVPQVPRPVTEANVQPSTRGPAPAPSGHPMVMDPTGSFPTIPELDSLYRERQQQHFGPADSAQPLLNANQHQAVPENFGAPPQNPATPINSGPVADVSPLPAFHGHSFSGASPGMSGFRATVESDAGHWMSPYVDRANNAAAGGMDLSLQELAQLPPNYQPWWDGVVREPTGLAASNLSVDISSLLRDAMLYSPQVLAIKTEPEVQRRVITQEAAKFDWTAFLEATYDDLNDPAGNSLATGDGADRLLTRKLYTAGGIRRRTLIGGDFRLAQEFGHENQNSRIFIPNDQASSRLELSYRQPLWDGAGRAYNESEIVLARIQANASEDEVVGALQDHLIEVTEAYWTLYRSRSEFFQRQKLLESARSVLIRLEGRSQVDTIPRQVLRARAATARAQTRIQRTIARVKDSEAQLRLLVNSPGMLNGGPTELTPIEAPRMVTEASELQSVLQTALINRSDISEAIRKMRASSVRLGVSQNEILPRLDLIVETYIADLAGSSDIPLALRGQWTDNRPGYTIGLEFEVPIENRAAIAKMEQRQWELKRSINVFKATVEKSLTDVEIANREVATAYSEMLSRYQSMKAAQDESLYLKDRFEVLPASEDSATLLLEDLLDSFERLADEETAFVQSQVDHAVAIIRLKKEIGILLQSRHDRPNIMAEDHAWVNERIQSAVERTQEPEIQQMSYSPDRTNTSGRIRSRIGHAISTQPTHQVVRPMPETPTQWSRMGTPVGKYSIR